MDFTPTAGTCYNSGLYAKYEARNKKDEWLCSKECSFIDFVKCPANGWDDKKVREYYELMKAKG